MMKYRDKKTQITIDLPENSKYNGYCVECSYSFDKDKKKYSVSMKLQRKDMDELQIINDMQYADGDKKTVDFSIRCMIEKLSKSDFFDKYIQQYEYTYKCFDKGNQFFEEESSKKNACPVKECEIVRYAYYCPHCGFYVEQNEKCCPHCNATLDWNNIERITE